MDTNVSKGRFFKKIMPMKLLSGWKDNHGRSVDGETEIQTQDQFLKMLALERKRSERSEKPIVLLTFGVHPLFDIRSKKEVISLCLKLLEETTRVIDIKGWYKENHTIGIIYTEVHESAIPPILQKNRNKLLAYFGEELSRLIELSYAIFPEKKADMSDGGGIADPRFYSESLSASFPQKVSASAKRTVDIAGGLFLILLFAPFFLAIALSIKLTSKGPVFFIQDRAGKGGKLFKFIKFRSMRVDADNAIHRKYVTGLINGSDGSTTDLNVYKMTNDPRVTPVGRIIRKTSLDELPQLFNILRGDMSLVGPRPAIPYEIENYRCWQRQRIMAVKPGLTGLWQVEGRSTTTFAAMVRMDLYYIRNRSLLGDLSLLIKTPLAMFRGGY
jgi:lipopolysaccharide/colanic/teichoic acid biosynthesis glycosyltransferase